MKTTVNVLVAGLLMVFSALTVNAQSPEDYFVGKWDIIVEGAPDGDMNMRVVVERKDGKLAGYISGIGEENVDFSQIDEKKNQSITAYFEANGYEVYLFLEKKDADSVEGSMMDMFDITGKRVKEEK
jgi:hypothetical protein